MLLASATLGLALAADAFAVAVCQGAAARRPTAGLALKLGGAFGAAQAGMPMLGWAAGLAVAGALAAIDHWIAFAILAALGAKMVVEGLTRADAAPAPEAGGLALLGLALATSLDAGAAGFAFDAMRLDPIFAAAVIGAVTGVVCVLGVYLGRAAGARLGKGAELIAGVALVLIGARILYEHGVFAG
jgi:putative Mn2+ efflux pump MntP